MTSELQFYRELIAKACSSCSGTEKKTLKKADYEQILQELEQERDAAKIQIFRQRFELDEEAAKLYIEQQQLGILRLANSLLKYLPEEERKHVKEISAEPTAANVCKSIYCSMEKLLFFLEKNFRELFDQDIALPELYRQVAVREFVQKEIVLRKRMAEKGVPEPLLSIGFHPVQEVIANPRGEGMTYREHMW